MTNHPELLRHAARCRDLAERCRDKAVAAKLRDLAHSYQELADVISASSARSSLDFGNGVCGAGSTDAFYLSSAIVPDVGRSR